MAVSPTASDARSNEEIAGVSDTRSNEETASVLDGRSSEEIAGILEEEFPMNLSEKFKLFLQIHWQGLVCILTPIIMIAVLVPFPPAKYQWCAYTLILMAVYWVTECIPLAVTSFLPIVIFPLTGVMSTSKTCSCYINDTIIMFLGSLILAYAVEQSGLHIRLALCGIRAIGYSHPRLLFAMSYITMFVSMWITNTPATTMMVPINFAILKVFEDQNLLRIYDTNANGDKIASDITTCYFCATTFSATIGGIGTLVGTATNLVFKGLFQRAYPDAPEYLSFPKFSAFSVPYMLLMETAMYLYMSIVYFGLMRPKSAAAKSAAASEEGIEAARISVNEKWIQLGRITFWEILVIILFSGAMILFFCRSPTIFTGWGDAIVEHYDLRNKKFVLDSAAAMFIGFLLLLFPRNLNILNNFKAKDYEELTSEPSSALIDWKVMNDAMPYGFMFLLGGGFALSEAAKKDYSDLNGRIGDMLKNLQGLNNYFIIFVIIVFTVFVTNFAANVAVCNVIAPIAMQMAREIGVNPLWYNIAAGFSASYCYCLPVGTPGNLIVQGAANIPTGKMIKAGIGPTIFTILLTWMCICFWAPVIWPDIQNQPNWIFS